MDLYSYRLLLKSPGCWVSACTSYECEPIVKFVDRQQQHTLRLTRSEWRYLLLAVDSFFKDFSIFGKSTFDIRLLAFSPIGDNRCLKITASGESILKVSRPDSYVTFDLNCETWKVLKNLTPLLNHALANTCLEYVPQARMFMIIGKHLKKILLYGSAGKLAVALTLLDKKNILDEFLNLFPEYGADVVDSPAEQLYELCRLKEELCVDASLLVQ